MDVMGAMSTDMSITRRTKIRPAASNGFILASLRPGLRALEELVVSVSSRDAVNLAVSSKSLN